ncbi:hypothetical protein AK812_SmicGene1351 [Symbiodinium microadriaticum]|uniref:EF-hand domain-containing protein n=1 Tax=Symbiodinium microadriaticum TaxID=2951 RepID=A0A1Q9F4D4_SYMMI|nr:hypothetical protein AK812_SmicGene1351 [Symbiodinium microadriaticum]
MATTATRAIAFQLWSFSSLLGPCAEGTRPVSPTGMDWDGMQDWIHMEAAQVFRLLDLDGSHELQLDEFVMGCMRLKGMAKGIDLETLMLECRKLASLFSKHRKLTKRQFARLEEMMAAGQREHRAAVHELAGLVASKVDASAL